MSDRPSQGWSGHRLALAIAAGIVLVWSLGMAVAMRAAALPPEASGAMIAVFPPALDENAALAAIVAAGGQPIRRTWIGSVWVVQGETPGYAGRLASEGALAAYREFPLSPEIAGCFAYADAKVADLFAIRP
jgi:pimeloyl-ACP methyl ester carboxylesterase